MFIQIDKIQMNFLMRAVNTVNTVNIALVPFFPFFFFLIVTLQQNVHILVF